MIKFLPILVNLVLGTMMLLLGFKVFVPKFPSEEVKAMFYKRWSAFLIIAGFVVLGATAFLLARCFSDAAVWQTKRRGLYSWGIASQTE